MSSGLRHVAPAGAPIGAADVVRWARTLWRDRAPVHTLQQHVRARTGVRYCAATCTGRAGMTVALRALTRLRRDAGRHEVLVPSYTCYSVAASVVRAGLTPHIVDISPTTLDYDWSRLARTDTAKALAIIGTNLYGLPSDMPRLATFARERGLFLVDDAAQAFGATVGGRPSGTWGDVGLYSLDKGKNVSAMDGGLLVSNNDAVSASLDAEVAALPPTPTGRLIATLVKLAAYITLLRPSLYWIPNGIPQLGLGQTAYDTTYAIEQYGRPLAALAVTMVPQLDRFTAARRSNAARLLQLLADVPYVTPVQPVAGSEPVYVRLPLLVADPDLRDALIAALTGAGIGATGSYPHALCDVPELAGYPASLAVPPGGASVARRILTLPTHPLVSHRDLERAAGVIRDVVGRYQPSPAAVPAVG